MAQSFSGRRSGPGEVGVVAMIMLMLVCAVLASLALGVLVAYGICQLMFRVFRVHAESAARSRVSTQPLRAVRS